MKNSKIANSLTKKFSKINARLNKAIQHFDTEAIHAFRVEVKKLRAFLRLMGTEKDDAHALKLPKKMRKFYKEVGLIRTLQLQRKRIHDAVLKTKEEVLPKAYLTILSSKIKTNVKYARNLVKGKAPFKKGERQILGSAPNKMGLTKRREFTWTEVTTLKNLIDPLFTSDDTLHSVRKLLKDLLFVWPKIRGEAAVILPSALLCSKEDLRFVAKRLGRFEDAIVGLKFLQENNASQITDEKERVFLKTLEKNWRAEKNALRNELHDLFQKRIPARPSFTLLADGNHTEIKNKLLSR